MDFAAGGKYVPHHPNQPSWSPTEGYRDMYYDMMERADAFESKYSDLRNIVFDDLLPLVTDEEIRQRLVKDIDYIDLGVY